MLAFLGSWVPDLGYKKEKKKKKKKKSGIPTTSSSGSSRLYLLVFHFPVLFHLHTSEQQPPSKMGSKSHALESYGIRCLFSWTERQRKHDFVRQNSCAVHFFGGWSNTDPTSRSWKHLCLLMPGNLDRPKGTFYLKKKLSSLIQVEKSMIFKWSNCLLWSLQAANPINQFFCK